MHMRSKHVTKNVMLEWTDRTAFVDKVSYGDVIVNLPYFQENPKTVSSWKFSTNTGKVSSTRASKLSINNNKKQSELTLAYVTDLLASV